MIGGIIIGVGMGALVKNILVMVTPPGAKKLIQFCTRVSVYFLGGLAAKAAADAFEERVDQTVIGIEKVSKIVDEHSNKIEDLLKET